MSSTILCLLLFYLYFLHRGPGGTFEIHLSYLIHSKKCRYQITLVADDVSHSMVRLQLASLLNSLPKQLSAAFVFSFSNEFIVMQCICYMYSDEAEDTVIRRSRKK